jgi:hypothetical protein
LQIHSAIRSIAAFRSRSIIARISGVSKESM